MEHFKTFIINALGGVHEKFFPFVEDIAGIVGGLVSIATLLYIGSKVWASYAKNEPVDIYPLLRPFAIAFLCANFTTMVCKPIDMIIEPISSYLGYKSTTYISDMAFNKMKFEEIVKNENETGDTDNANTDTEEKFKLKKFLSSAWNFIVGRLFLFICMLFETVINILRILLAAILLCSRVFFLSILCMVGPISFAISLLPGYQQTLNQWIAKYVSISFWLPMIYLCDLFVSVLTAAMLDGFGTFLHDGGAVTLLAGKFPQALGIIALLMTVVIAALSYFMYTTVPTISSWIITGGDVHGIQGMLGATTILSALTAYGGMKAGNSLAQSNAGTSSGGVKGVGIGKSSNGIGNAIGGLFGKK